MPISGIHLQTQTNFFKSILVAMKAIQGVTVHNIDAESGRVILTLETESIEHQEDTLQMIQRTEGVTSAELIYLYNDQEEDKT